MKPVGGLVYLTAVTVDQSASANPGTFGVLTNQSASPDASRH